MGRRVLQLKNAVLRHLAVPGLAMLIATGSAPAQSGDTGKPPANAAAATDAAKEAQRKAHEFVEAAQAINGPAGNPECVWLGRRMVGLMWNDDLDTAFRHLDLYDRFGCPGAHIQAAFRCLTRFAAEIDPKVADSLNSHVHACWINPAAKPQAAAAAPSAGGPATAGTSPPSPAPAPQAAAPPPAAPAAAPAK
jgi:hypothetical protein